jgi:ferric-dicitrate binding protein FerR (iron transport regulator)
MTPGSPDDPNIFDALLRRASRRTPSRDVDRMWTRLRGAIERESPRSEGRANEPRPVKFREFPRRPFPSAAWAAALALLLGGSALLTLRNRSTEVAASPDHIYSTGPAQTAKVRLGDGSLVVLAPMSRLRVPADFGERARVVTIEGEGFFDVQHNGAMPFRVRAKSAIAEDIGTRFDVRAYRDEAGVAIIVAEGAVTLGEFRGETAARAEGVVARSGQRARTGGPDGLTTVDQVSVHLTDWTQGRLTFVKTPLAEIARTIGRWYDLDVRVADAATGRRLITAEFDAESPKAMADALAMAIQGSVQQRGRTLIIGPTQ